MPRFHEIHNKESKLPYEPPKTKTLSEEEKLKREEWGKKLDENNTIGNDMPNRNQNTEPEKPNASEGMPTTRQGPENEPNIPPTTNPHPQEPTNIPPNTAANTPPQTQDLSNDEFLSQMNQEIINDIDESGRYEELDNIDFEAVRREFTELDEQYREYLQSHGETRDTATHTVGGDSGAAPDFETIAQANGGDRSAATEAYGKAAESVRPTQQMTKELTAKEFSGITLVKAGEVKSMEELTSVARQAQTQFAGNKPVVVTAQMDGKTMVVTENGIHVNAGLPTKSIISDPAQSDLCIAQFNHRADALSSIRCCDACAATGLTVRNYQNICTVKCNSFEQTDIEAVQQQVQKMMPGKPVFATAQHDGAAFVVGPSNPKTAASQGMQMPTDTQGIDAVYFSDKHDAPGYLQDCNEYAGEHEFDGQGFDDAGDVGEGFGDVPLE